MYIVLCFVLLLQSGVWSTDSASSALQAASLCLGLGNYGGGKAFSKSFWVGDAISSSRKGSQIQRRGALSIWSWQG